MKERKNMTTQQLIDQLKTLERRIFAIEMDEFAYIHGRGAEIDQLSKEMERIQKQLAQA